MDSGTVQSVVREQFGMRIEREMSEYVLRQLAGAGEATRTIPVMGGDARTGLPVRTELPVDALQSAVEAASQHSQP